MRRSRHSSRHPEERDRIRVRDKFAPRLGAAYTCSAMERSSCSAATADTLNDWTKYELSRGSFGGDIWKVYYHALEDPNLVPTINLSNLPGRDLWEAPPASVNRRVPAFDTIESGNQADEPGQASTPASSISSGVRRC
jgi:hypothetical protein